MTTRFRTAEPKEGQAAERPLRAVAAAQGAHPHHHAGAGACEGGVARWCRGKAGAACRPAGGGGCGQAVRSCARHADPEGASMIKLAIYEMARTITRHGTSTPFLLFAARWLAPWRRVFLPLVPRTQLIYAAKPLTHATLTETDR